MKIKLQKVDVCMKEKQTLISRILMVCLAASMITSASVPVNAKDSGTSSNQENEKKEYPMYETYYVVNCKESITLRPQPDVKSGEICRIPFGAAVSFVESDKDGFYQIVYNGTVGYALAAYLSKEKPSESAYASSAQINTIIYPTYYVVNCKQSITLRTSPSTSAGEICQIPLGSAVSYMGSVENGFYKIIYNGSTGYGLASYLSPYRAYETVSNPVSYPTYYVVNCRQSITLRTSADTSASEICQIPLGAAVSYISAASNGFYYISYNGNTGYALASYLSSTGNSSYYDTCRVVNCNESITLRPAPDVDSGEICQIPLGATVSFVAGAPNGFYEIYYMGEHGYSLADYLEFQ